MVGRRVATVLAALACALAGCGGEDGERAATTTTTGPSISSVPAPTPAGIAITAPPTSRPLVGRAVDARRQRVALTLTGTAAPRQNLRVRGDCRDDGCSTFVFANAEGDWRASLTLMLPRTARSTIVIAADAVADREAQIVRRGYRLKAVAPPRPRAQRRSSGSGGSGGSTGSADATATVPPADAGSGSTVPNAAPSPTPTIPDAVDSTSGSGSSGRLILIGDSLAVGMKDALPAQLPGWKVSVDGRVGRPLAEGMGLVRSATIPDDAVLAISLFTNDEPTATDALRSAVAESLRTTRGCVVWATIVRPPVGGVSYRAANQVLARAASQNDRLRIADWAAAVAAQPSLVGGDGVHPSPAGYRQRATLYARAARSCGS